MTALAVSFTSCFYINKKLRKEGKGMKVIFEEYSGIIITVVAILALVVIVGVLLATNGPIHNAFINLINGLFSKTNVVVPGP
jgi:hypothetical protein